MQMSDNTNEQLAKDADRLHMRALRASGSIPDSQKLEHLGQASQLFERARSIYRAIGDEDKATEVEASLVSLYKQEYEAARQRKQSKGPIAEAFDSWLVFFKIGCFGFGGPMAVFSLLEEELVGEKEVLSQKDFLEGAVLGEVLPGPVTMDIVTYTGYKLQKWSGAFISTLAFILPSFVLMIALAALYDQFRMVGKVEEILKCLGAAVTGLILSVGLKLSGKEIVTQKELCIMIWAFVLALVLGFNVLLTVLLTGLTGIVFYQGKTSTEQETL